MPEHDYVAGYVGSGYGLLPYTDIIVLVGSLLYYPHARIDVFRAPTRPRESGVFLERIVRWAAEALFALTTMTACSQRVELRAAWALDTAVRCDV